MNILIVDDEPMIREWFQMTVERLGQEYAIAGEASDGEEALRFCEKHAVDLVVTDVKMPGMNGLELLKRLKEMKPGLRVVIFSSYSEFQFAAEALKLGAREYMLKAEITLKELGGILTRIKREMEMEQGERMEVSSLRTMLNQNELALRTAYFRELLDGKSVAETEERFEEQMRLFRTPLAAKNLTLLAVSLIRDGEGEKSIRLREPKLLELAVTNIIDETLQNEIGNGCSLLLRDDTYVVLANADATGMKSRREMLLIAASRIAEHLSKFLGAEAAIGISTTYSRLSYLVGQLREALEASEQDLFYGERSIVFPPAASEPHAAAGEVYALRDEFRSRMESGQFGLAGERLKELLDKLGAEKALVPKQARAVVLELVYIAIGKARQIGGVSAELDEVYGNAPYEIQRLSYRRLRDWAIASIGNIQDWIDRHRKKYGEATQRAIDYIRARFSNDPTLQEVADHVHLSRTYFSELFKKETGMNFNEFLIQVRLEHAKRLLSERAMRVSEVAERVGYGNASYFIKVFKKQFGVSPYEYMESLHGTRNR